MQGNSFNVSGGVANETYDYFDDGRLSYSHNTIDTKFDRKFSYDHAGRLTEASSGGLARNDSTDVPMYETFQYDRFDHTIDRLSASWNNNFYDSGSYANNRRGGWGYDLDGRVATIDTRGYSYNAAGENTSVSGQRWTPGDRYVPTNTSSDLLNAAAVGENE